MTGLGGFCRWLLAVVAQGTARDGGLCSPEESGTSRAMSSVSPAWAAESCSAWSWLRAGTAFLGRLLPSASFWDSAVLSGPSGAERSSPSPL